MPFGKHPTNPIRLAYGIIWMSNEFPGTAMSVLVKMG